MKTRVLYFPYIKVPKSQWLTQMLLYWDQVSSIVPYDYILRPDMLGEYMRDLVEEEMVFQVIPGRYVYLIPNFEQAFMNYIMAQPALIESRRKNFKDGATVHIHIEKMGELPEYITNLGIARPAKYPWYEVEKGTGEDFMAYLAMILGQIAEIDSMPITDSETRLGQIVGIQVTETVMLPTVESMRMEILKDILPVPKKAVSATDIRCFKNEYGHELRAFRTRVERELVESASISDEQLRKRHLEVFVNEAKSDIEEIIEAMRGKGWETTQSSISVLSAIPGISPLIGLASAIWAAMSSKKDTMISNEFAYAAHVRTRFT